MAGGGGNIQVGYRDLQQQAPPDEEERIRRAREAQQRQLGMTPEQAQAFSAQAPARNDIRRFNELPADQQTAELKDRLYAQVEGRDQTQTFMAPGSTGIDQRIRNPAGTAYGGSRDASQSYFDSLSGRLGGAQGPTQGPAVQGQIGQGQQQQALGMWQQLYGGQGSLGAQQINASAQQAQAQQQSLAHQRGLGIGAAQRQIAAGQGQIQGAQDRSLAMQQAMDQQAALTGMGQAAGQLSQGAFTSAGLAAGQQSLGDMRQKMYLDQLSKYAEDEAARQQRLGTGLEEGDVNRRVANQQAALNSMGQQSQIQGFPWQALIGGGFNAGAGILGTYLDRNNR